MNDRLQTRLASILAIAVGGWLVASPLFIQVSDAAFINVLIVGGIIALTGLVQLIWTSTLPSWVMAIAAIWLAVTAFVFSAGADFVWSAVLSAIAAFILAVWDGIEVSHVQHHEHHASV
jgi:hypothetical protein